MLVVVHYIALDYVDDMEMANSLECTKRHYMDTYI